MKINVLKPILTVILIHAGMVYGQGENDYTLSSDKVEITSQAVEITSTIEKLGSLLKWTQENNGTTNTTDFEIANTTGTWDTSTSQGELVHILNIEGYEGRFVLTGTASGISAILTIAKTGETGQEYNFLNSTITYQ